MAIRPYTHGRYLVDWYDGTVNPKTGKPRRRWKTQPSKEAARIFEAEQRLKKAKAPKLNAQSDPDIRLRDFIDTWLAGVKADSQPTTYDLYRWAAERYIKPAPVAALKVREIAKQDCRAFIRHVSAEPLARAGTVVLSKKSARLILTVFQLLLSESIELEIRADNPMPGLVGRMRKRNLITGGRETEYRVKAFTREQLALVLETAHTHTPHWYPVFFTMSRTGMRPGELAALRVADLNFITQKIRVARSRNRYKTIKSTKTQRERSVDMSGTCRTFLQQHLHATGEHWHATDRTRPDWVFLDDRGRGEPTDQSSARSAFKRVVRLAGLGDHCLYDLRHTFASLLLQSGASIKYVQEQLGHADIKLTVHLYGSWLPASNPALLDVLDPILVDATVEVETESLMRPRHPDIRLLTPAK